MRSEFDPLHTAPLPDSFERTAAWLRQAPPPRPHRAPSVALAALLVFVGACSWPVSTTIAAGAVIELLSTDRIGVGHPTLATLDRLVPDEHQHMVELASVGEDGADGTIVRYAVLGADEPSVGRWRDTMAAQPGIQAVRVVDLDVIRRRPLGVSTVQRVLGVSSTPHLSDAQLQVELDRVLAETLPITIHVRRTASGERALDVGENVTLTLRPGARISQLPSRDSAMRGIAVDGLEPGGVSIAGRTIGPEGETPDTTRFEDARALEVALDSLSPDIARMIRDRIDANRLRVDSAYRGTLRADTTAQVFLFMRSDSLRRSLPRGARVDTVRRTLRVQTLRDSL
ncbi:MAG: hypothetical protein AAF845_11195 [Bacteroidota bacterium]